MELASGGCRRLFISGTASIWPDGRTAWVDDPVKQIELTMDVVTAILRSRDMSHRDITRATAYFQDIDYKSHFDAWCDRNEFRRPVIALQADVCRDDLMFEIEVDAVVPTAGSDKPPSFDI
jgi:enamine deaminase RidA (YjgF/YER057c/UK114 family)